MSKNMYNLIVYTSTYIHFYEWRKSGLNNVYLHFFSLTARIKRLGIKATLNVVDLYMYDPNIFFMTARLTFFTHSIHKLS